MQLPVDLVETLSGDTEMLKELLLSHVVPGAVFSNNLTNDATVKTVGGTELRTNIYLKSDFYDGFTTINGKRIEKADIEATNGVIHIITDVIYPIIDTNTTIADIISTDPRSQLIVHGVKILYL